MLRLRAGSWSLEQGGETLVLATLLAILHTPGLLTCHARLDHAGDFCGVPQEKCQPVAERQWTVRGKVVSLEGEVVGGAPVWIAPFSAPSCRLGETRASGSGSFSLQINLNAQTPDLHRLMLGVRHPGFLETRELLNLGVSPEGAEVTLLLRSATESFEEPNLDALDVRLMRRLSRPQRSHRKAESACRDLEEVLDWYRRQPHDIPELERVLHATLDSKFAEAQLLASVALMRLGAWAAAERTLAGITPESGGLPETYLVQGVLLNLLRRPEEATQVLEQALKHFPRDGLVELELGRSALLAEDWPTAEQWMGAALGDRALTPHVRYLRLRALLAQGRLEAASREAKALARSMGRKPLPPAVKSVLEDVQQRLEERSLQAIESVMHQSVSDLMRSVNSLRGLDPQSPPPPGGLAGFLKQVGITVARFFQDFANTAATEIVWQTRLDKKGRPARVRSKEFYYLLLNRSGLGRSWVEEFRSVEPSQQLGDADSEVGYMVTSGFAASLIVFHQDWQPEVDYRFLGRQQVAGRPVFVIGFAQRPGASPPLGIFRVTQGKSAYLYLQGIAWISAEQHQVLRLRTDLLQPVSEINLNRQTADIDYRPYRFLGSPKAFWLPNRVSVSVEWARKRLRNEHILSKYRLFKVDTVEAGASRKLVKPTRKSSPN